MKVKKRVGITAISLCAVALAVPAIGFAALNSTTEKYEISITYGDLDLTRKAGVQTLYHRLTSAATKACGSTSFSELGSIKWVVENKRCHIVADLDTWSEGEEWRSMLLSLLSLDRNQTSLRIARTVWMKRPEAFGYEHVVALAERGAFEFEREIEIMVAEHDVDDLTAVILPAARLALQGHWDGSHFLVRWLESKAAAGTGELYLTFVAAASLEALGEPSYARLLCEELDRRIEEALERGVVVLARELVVAADYFETPWRRRDGASIGILATRIRSHGRSLEGSLETSEQIRARWGTICPH